MRSIERLLSPFWRKQHRGIVPLNENGVERKSHLQLELHNLCGKAVKLLALGEQIVPKDQQIIPLNAVSQTFSFRFPSCNEIDYVEEVNQKPQSGTA